jgi:hypothetical protein
MGKIRVRRKGFYIKRGGKRIYIPPTTFYIKDRGAKGRGKKVIPPLKAGALGISFDWPEEKIKEALIAKASKEGEKKVVSRLVAIGVLNKRVNPAVSKKAMMLAHWLAGSFRGNKYVGYPHGFGSGR